jgi:endonuclease-8
LPEGDTIYRAARTLHSAMAGQRVVRFETALAPLARVNDQTPIAGRNIERVVAAGKHLIFDFSGGLHLRTHMRMNGSWHIYKAGERWKRPRREMRVVIATADWQAVGFSIPVAEFLDDRTIRRQEDLRRIGPDLLADVFDAGEALRRMRARPAAEIADVLLNQRVVAGAGNVFKSEILFLAGINPFTAVGDLDDAAISRLLAIARKLLRYNVTHGGSDRVTTGSIDRSKKLWVYGRGGEACRRCGTAIAYRKQGPDARGTYWCERCQVTGDGDGDGEC